MQLRPRSGGTLPLRISVIHREEPTKRLGPENLGQSHILFFQSYGLRRQCP